jgi:hypothetical protein
MKNSKAQSLVEFSLTLPLLILIILMIFDLGRVVYYFTAINHGAHEGVRYGSAHYNVADEGEIISRIKDASIGVGSAIQIGTDDLCVCFDSLDRAHLYVDIAYSFKPVTPIVGRFLGPDNSVDLVADASMILEFPIDKGSTDYSSCDAIPDICVSY